MELHEAGMGLHGMLLAAENKPKFFLQIMIIITEKMGMKLHLKSYLKEREVVLVILEYEKFSHDKRPWYT